MTNASFFERMTVPGSRTRRLAIATILYVACTIAFASLSARQTLTEHTPFNHYALQAEAWLHGRQDLENGPPAYAQGNDFAVFEGKTYISFPPFPAALMFPFVAASGSAENFRDGQFILWLAGLAPAFLFLVLEKLRRVDANGVARSTRTETENVVLAVLFAMGTVYCFTAVQGTVWFAAQVVGTGVFALYVLFALDAERPLVAGALLACAFMTRPPMLLAGSLFALEAIRVCTRDGLPTEGSLVDRAQTTWSRLDKAKLTRAYALFAIPILGALAIESVMNHYRFHTWNPTVGHQYLTVVWAVRMKKWGLFGFHYLSKNLGAMLSILPWLPARPAPPNAPAFIINEHGLALWFTTPLYLWILWPRRRSGNIWLYTVVALSAALPAFLDLLYQNSGWRQFGYRFSNDYAVLLFMLLALGDRTMGWLFRTAAAWSIAWNVFGAASFDRRGYDQYYFREGSQTILYQPD
jgi:hypothetical protein